VRRTKVCVFGYTLLLADFVAGNNPSAFYTIREVRCCVEIEALLPRSSHKAPAGLNSNSGTYPSVVEGASSSSWCPDMMAMGRLDKGDGSLVDRIDGGFLRVVIGSRRCDRDDGAEE
jgi:hypothetical protein